jgi:hypothetical protein
MVYRVLPLFVALVAVVLFASAPALAADDAKLSMHEGKIVSVTGNKLVMSVDGKEHTHDVAADAKIRLDGKDGKLADLKPGMKIRVWTPKDNAKTALRIDALDKNKDFEK